MGESSNKNILLIGCGNLGSALLKSWTLPQLLESSIGSIVVIEPSLLQRAYFQDGEKNIQFITGFQEIPADFKADFIILAIKPQVLESVIPQLCNYLKLLVDNEVTVISVLAGTSIYRIISLIQSCDNFYPKVLRIMPNIGLKVGHSVNLAYTSQMDDQELKEIEELFKPSGEILWLPNEELIEALTPISGSGPAYFFLLAEILVRLTEKQGIKPEIAKKIIQKVLLGSAYLALEDNNFQELISAVASKGGVTEAALKVLRPTLPDLIDQAFKTAAEASAKLSSEK